MTANENHFGIGLPPVNKFSSAMVKQIQNFKKLPLAPVIAGLNKKGGVTKSSTTMSMATIAAHAGLRTLIIEVCEQRDITRKIVLDEEETRKLGGAYQVMLNPSTPPEKYITETFVDNLWIIPAIPGSSENFTEKFKNGFANGIHSAKVAFKHLRRGFDIIFVDMPPGTNAMFTTILAACTHYFYLVNTDESSLNAVGEMEAIIKRDFRHFGPDDKWPVLLGALMVDLQDMPKTCKGFMANGHCNGVKYIKHMIPHSKRPKNFTVYSGAINGDKDYWIKNPYSRGKVTSPIEIALFQLVHWLMMCSGLIEKPQKTKIEFLEISNDE